MPLPNDLLMRPATDADLPVIGALREAVGWEAHEWALRAVLGQPEARCVVVVDALDRIVGVGSGISYGALGVIGNMVVAEDRRRRGVGAAILDAVVDFLVRERDCTRVELNATDEGRPLYEGRGFASIGASSTGRIRRDTALVPDPSVAVRTAAASDLDTIAGYDRPRFGGDRRPLFQLILGEAMSPFLVAELDGQMAGYACLHVNVPRIGPVVADAPSVAASVVHAAFQLAPDVQELRLNLPPSNRAGAEWLRGLGLEVETWDGRMARGPQVPRREETIYGMSVGALG